MPMKNESEILDLAGKARESISGCLDALSDVEQWHRSAGLAECTERISDYIGWVESATAAFESGLRAAVRRAQP